MKRKLKIIAASTIFAIGATNLNAQTSVEKEQSILTGLKSSGVVFDQKRDVEEKLFSNRVVVELADPAIRILPKSYSSALLLQVGKVLNVTIKPLFKLGTRFIVLELPEARSDSDVRSIIERMKGMSEFLNVEQDQLVTPFRNTFNDTGWGNLFDFYNATSEDRISLPKRYNPLLDEVAKASRRVDMRGVTIAVIDSGIRTDEPDLTNSDFLVTKTIIEGKMTDGANELAAFSHGTAVAGIIGAKRNNAFKLAGITPDVNKLMLKVFRDDGGGFQSDAMLASLYAVNLHDREAIPSENPFVADVINLSLGSAGAATCNTFSRATMEEVVNSGAIVVAASGNEGLFGIGSPASCPGVISVGAANSKGFSTGYSNVSPALVTATFGGDPDTGNLFPTLGRSNSTPNGFIFGVGTSYATPVITAVIAMAKALNPQLSAQTAITAIKSTQIAYSDLDINCSGTSKCGGLFNTQGFLQETTGLDIIELSTEMPVVEDRPENPEPPTTPENPPVIDDQPKPPAEQDNPQNPSTEDGSGDGSARGGSSAPVVEYKPEIGSVAKNILEAYLVRADGFSLNGSTVTVQADSLILNIRETGELFVYFRGFPVSNSNSINPSATTYSDGSSLYGFRVLRANADSFPVAGSVSQVSEGQSPPVIQPQAGNRNQSSEVPIGNFEPTGGSGGGGSLGGGGLLALWAGVWAYRRKRTKKNGF